MLVEKVANNTRHIDAEKPVFPYFLDRLTYLLQALQTSHFSEALLRVTTLCTFAHKNSALAAMLIQPSCSRRLSAAPSLNIVHFRVRELGEPQRG